MTTSSTPERPGKKNDQIISYYTLRVLIGAAGVLLPFLLLLAKAFTESSYVIEYSISDYYDNSTAGDILVGILFALSFFLFSYKGYDKVDRRTAIIASISALGVALFPTTSKNITIHQLHFVFALLLFASFIFFSIYLFRKSGSDVNITKEKEQRNTVYFVCGIIMIVCVVGIAVSSFLLQELAKKYQLVFWLEAVALIAFGFSWITKSEYLFLKDTDNQAQKNKF